MKKKYSILTVMIVAVVVGLCLTVFKQNVKDVYAQVRESWTVKYLTVNKNAKIQGTATFSNSSGIDVSGGNITLENDEQITNDTDGDVAIAYNDDATTLGQFFLVSTIDSPLVADNDIFEIVMQANDDSSNYTDWVTLQSKVLDASDDSEDSEFSVLTWLAGTEYTSVKWAGNVMTQYADAAAYWTATQANAGGVTFNSTSDGTPSFTFSDAIVGGVAGTGIDVTFYSGTSGDQFLWDASEEALILTGTAGQTALNIADGNLVVADSVQIGGGKYFSKLFITAAAGSLGIVVTPQQANKDTAWLPLN